MLPPYSDNRPAWHILGAGAIGCLYAAHCASNQPVRLILSAERKHALAQAGEQLEVTGIDGQRRNIPERCLETNDDDTTIHRLILCTKAHQSRQALSDIGHRLHPQAIIILLQNGLGVSEEIQSLWPQVQLISASTTHGAWRRTRNHIVHAGLGETLFDSRCGEAIQSDIQAQLSHPDCIWQAVDDMPARLWQKLAINCAINPFTALLQCRNGELIQHDLEAQQTAVCAEVHAVANASGIALPNTEQLMHKVQQVMQATANNRSSMLQDVLAGRATEIDYLNGFVQRRGEELGIDCPHNRQLWQQVSALANKDKRSS